MKRIVNASLGERTFAFDEDAYDRLLEYLGHFKSRLGADTKMSESEIMSDVENRLAELFIQGMGGVPNRSVSYSIVEAAVRQLGMPDGDAEPYEKAGTGDSVNEEPYAEEGSSPGFKYFGELGNARRKLYRDIDHKAIGGVCSGLGAYFNIDVTIIRIIMLCLLVFACTGLVVYLVFWITVPAARTSYDKCLMYGLEPTAGNLGKFPSSGKRK